MWFRMTTILPYFTDYVSLFAEVFSSIPLNREVRASTCQTALIYFLYCAVRHAAALTFLFRGGSWDRIPIFNQRFTTQET